MAITPPGTELATQQLSPILAAKQQAKQGMQKKPNKPVKNPKRQSVIITFKYKFGLLHLN